MKFLGIFGEFYMYEKLALLLKQHGISASKLAKETGISAPSLTYWKQGKYTPQAKTIQAIANYFNVPVAYFYDDTEYALGMNRLLRLLNRFRSSMTPKRWLSSKL